MNTVDLHPTRPIGIFDSGLGGLTVFKAIVRLLPQERLIYLGDTARVPYGTKSSATVTRYSEENTAFLIQHQVKAVVVACNTASAYAVPTLKQESAIPLLGVLEPGAARACHVSREGRIGVIGTAGTVASGAYEQAIRRIRSDATVTTKACPLFVPLAEEGWLNRDETYSIARHYLQPLLDGGLDTLILGCTHYPMLHGVIQDVVGPEVQLIDSAQAVAEALQETLREQDLLRGHGTEPGAASSAPIEHRFFVTDDPARFRQVGEVFLGHSIDNVQLV